MAAAAAKVPGSEAGSERPSILLVEDDVLLRLVTADELRRAGLSVVEARDADEAMTILDSAFPIDIVLTDIRMPGAMDGIGLAITVRQRWPELKVVFLSGEPPPRTALHAGDDFFAKPYDPAGLVSRIRFLVGTAKA